MYIIDYCVQTHISMFVQSLAESCKIVPATWVMSSCMLGFLAIQIQINVFHRHIFAQRLNYSGIHDVFLPEICGLYPVILVLIKTLPGLFSPVKHAILSIIIFYCPYFHYPFSLKSDWRS